MEKYRNIYCASCGCLELLITHSDKHVACGEKKCISPPPLTPKLIPKKIKHAN